MEAPLGPIRDVASEFDGLQLLRDIYVCQELEIALQTVCSSKVHDIVAAQVEKSTLLQTALGC